MSVGSGSALDNGRAPAGSSCSGLPSPPRERGSRPALDALERSPTTGSVALPWPGASLGAAGSLAPGSTGLPGAVSGSLVMSGAFVALSVLNASSALSA